MVVAERPDQGHALVVGVVEGPVHRGDDHPLLGLVLGRVGRVGGAVVEPRVDVEGHVDDVEADVGAVRQRVHHRLEEDVAAVLAAADLDQRDVRSDAGEPGAVGSGGRPCRPRACRGPESSQPTGSLQLLNSHAPSMAGMSVTKFRDCAASKFGARSGLRASSPESRMPTVTPLSPACTVRALSDRTIRSPHSLLSRGSIPAVVAPLRLRRARCHGRWRGCPRSRRRP